MYTEERIKIGIDVCLVYFGVAWLSSLLYQIVTAIANSISILSVASKHLSIFLAIKPALLIVLLVATCLLSKKYKLQINNMVFMISGFLLIVSSISVMAMVFHSVFLSAELAKQTIGDNQEVFKQVATSNYISAVDNVLNLLAGIFLVFIGERSINKQKAHPLC